MRTRLPIAAAAALALALTGCSDTTTEQPSDATPAATDVATDPATDAAPSPSPTASENDGVHVDEEPPADIDPSDIDPSDQAAYDQASADLADNVTAADLAAVLDVDPDTAAAIVPELADTGAVDTGAFVAYSFNDEITLVVTLGDDDQYIDDDAARNQIFGEGNWQQVDVTGAQAAYRYDLDIAGLTMKVDGQVAQLHLDGGPADTLPALAQVVAGGLAG